MMPSSGGGQHSSLDLIGTDVAGTSGISVGEKIAAGGQVIVFLV